MGLVAPIWTFHDFGSSQIIIVLGFSYFEFTIHYWTLCVKWWFSAFHSQIYKNFLTLWIPRKKGFGWKEAKRQGDFADNFSIHT
jgi:hypothetical protein